MIRLARSTPYGRSSTKPPIFSVQILRNEEGSVQQLRATLDQKSSELERQRKSVEEQKNRLQTPRNRRSIDRS